MILPTLSYIFRLCNNCVILVALCSPNHCKVGCHFPLGEFDLKSRVILSCYGHEIKQPIKFLVLIRTTGLIGPLIW